MEQPFGQVVRRGLAPGGRLFMPVSIIRQLGLKPFAE